MPTFNFTKTYEDGFTLTDKDLTALFDSIESGLNITQVDADNIQASGITTALIEDASITAEALPALGQQVSESSGNYTNGSGLADVTNLSCSITTTGRPVFIALIPDGSSNASYLAVTDASGTADGVLTIDRGGSNIALFNLNFTDAGGTGEQAATIIKPVGCVKYVDVVGAGVYTYKLRSAGETGTLSVAYCKLVVFEM